MPLVYRKDPGKILGLPIRSLVPLGGAARRIPPAPAAHSVGEVVALDNMLT
jgi:hypothetical protein